MKQKSAYLFLVFYFLLGIFNLNVFADAKIENIVKFFTPEQEKTVSATFSKNFPLKIDDLRIVYVGFYGFDNQEHQGTLIVNKSVADDILKVFQKLNKEKFPIRRMDAIFGLKNIYGNNLSIDEQDNTVAFHARKEVDYRRKWSQHAYGLAVDLNPVENPFIDRREVTPLAGKNFQNRKDVRPGMVVKDNVAYKAFEEIGWKWGGNWNEPKDYMHFSKTGE